jgi:spermidine synthase
MQDTFNFWDSFKSYFKDVIIEEIQSENGSIYTIKLVEGKLVLDFNRQNVSFGSIHRAFQRIFRTLKITKKEISSVLILGLGAGSIPVILRKDLHINAAITGVENDPIILKLARKYFQFDQIQNLNIIEKEASEFLYANTQTFDLIIVDLGKQGTETASTETENFLFALKKTLNPSGMIIFNRQMKSKKEKHHLKTLQTRFQSVFGTIRVIKVRENLDNCMICYEDHTNGLK